MFPLSNIVIISKKIKHPDLVVRNRNGFYNPFPDRSKYSDFFPSFKIFLGFLFRSDSQNQQKSGFTSSFLAKDFPVRHPLGEIRRTVKYLILLKLP